MRLKKRKLMARDTLRKLIEQDDRKLEAIERELEWDSESPYVEAWQTVWKITYARKERHKYALDILEYIQLGKPVSRYDNSED